jgi:mRNA-degrading endonuclease toxin of MazEF toxin-antitoxin module
MMTLAAPSPASIVKSPALTLVKPGPDLRHRRGEIWFVASERETPAVGTEIWSDRPAVIVSNNVLNGRSGFAQVVYLSTSARKRTGPMHVEVPAPDGRGYAMALCEQIHTVDASRLRRKMGALTEDRIRDVDAAMALALSIGRNPDTYSVFHKWEQHIKLNGIDIAKEINALAGLTTDHRVEALAEALKIMTVERDSYRNLFEASKERDAALGDVAKALGIELS